MNYLGNTRTKRYIAAMPFARIPPGDAGTRATLRYMRRYTNEGVRAPLTIDLVSRIVSGVLGNRRAQIQALRGWVGLKTRFQRDPYGVETIRTVPEMLADIQRHGVVQADCDDVAVLSAALGKAVGSPARFIAVAFGSPTLPFQHVYTEVWDGQNWQSFDVTRPRHAPAVARQMVVEV